MYELLSTYTDRLALSHTTLPTLLLQTHAHAAAIPSPPVATHPLSPKYSPCYRSKEQKWQYRPQQAVRPVRLGYLLKKNPTAPALSLLATRAQTGYHSARSRSHIQ